MEPVSEHINRTYLLLIVVAAPEAGLVGHPWYRASKEGAISEWVGKDVEGSGRGLIIKELFKRFLEGTEDNHEKFQRV
jgi:hypothetical protein